MSKDEKKGLDLLGLARITEAIPKKVYTQTTETLLTTFNKLTAPITETTDGFGRYLHQKFDNMVQVEKALATYTLEKAISKAEERSKQRGTALITPVHPKSFINAIEESSKETNPLLHEMWANLISTQLTDSNFHPHFVELLPHFSPSEAKLLVSLLSIDEIGPHGGNYLSFNYDLFRKWIKKSGETESYDWNYSCVLLCEFNLADVLSSKRGEDSDDRKTILYRTEAGNTFLSAVGHTS